jgi:hypothetical protein
MPVIAWFSRHAPVPSQLAELRRIYGPDVEVRQDLRPFGTADDIVERYRASGAVDMVAVAPLSVISALVDRGLRPLWAEMEEVPCDDPRAEVRPTGNRYRYSGQQRCYRFVRFRRITAVRLEMEAL